MNNQWNIPIYKLMIWRAHKWCKYDSNLGKTTLRIHQDQLMLISNSKLLESFNMTSKIKGIFKEDILILTVGTISPEIRKIRFQIKTNVKECLNSLGEHFPIMSYGGLPLKTTQNAKYRNVDEIFKHALDNNEFKFEVPLPHDYKNFVKLCLLDPTFPQYVAETMKIIEENLDSRI